MDALHDLYDQAGRPGARVISAAIFRDPQKPERVSHETISSVLRGDSVPAWAKVRSIITQLTRDAVGQHDLRVTVERLHELWLGARSESASRAAIVGSTELAPNPLQPTPIRGKPAIAPAGLPPHELASAPRIVGGLPERNLTFVGREALLARIRAELKTHSYAPLVLHGLGGVGKTQLASEYAHRHAEHYGLIWWIPADQAAHARSSLVSLGEQLRVPVEPSMERSALRVISHLESQRLKYLLIFDGAQDAEVRRLMPNIGGHVIVTTRDSALARDSSGLAVPVFDNGEAVQFLRLYDSRLSSQQAESLLQDCGLLPLAVAQVAAMWTATGLGWETLRQQLHRSESGLLSNAQPDHYSETVPASVRLALSGLRAVNPAAALAFELFAWFDPRAVSIALLRVGGTGDVTAALARALQDVIQVRKAVAEISRFGMAKLNGDGQQVEVQPLIRLALLEALPPEARERARRNAHEILAAADPGWPDDLASLDMHREIAPHVLPTGLVHSATESAGRTVLNQIRYRILIGEFEDACRLGEAAVTTWRAEEAIGPDHERVLLATAEWANGLRALGRYERARSLTAEAMQRLRGNPEFGEDHPHTLAMARDFAADLRIGGEYSKAVTLDEETTQRSLARWGETDHRTAASFYGLTASLRLVGDFARAEAIDQIELNRTRVMFTESPGPAMLWLSALAEDLYGLGKYHDVLDLEPLIQEIEGRHGHVNRSVLLARRTVALARQALGGRDEALTSLSAQYHACIEALGNEDPITLATTMSYANALRQHSQGGEAYIHAAVAVGVYRRSLGSQNPLTLATEVNLATIVRTQGERSRALQTDLRARDALRAALGDHHPYSIAVTANLATDFAFIDDHGRARELSEQAYALSSDVRGPHHLETLKVGANLILDRQATEAAGESTELQNRILDTLRRTIGPHHLLAQEIGERVRVSLTIEPPPV